MFANIVNFFFGKWINWEQKAIFNNTSALKLVCFIALFFNTQLCFVGETIVRCESENGSKCYKQKKQIELFAIHSRTYSPTKIFTFFSLDTESAHLIYCSW